MRLTNSKPNESVDDTIRSGFLLVTAGSIGRRWIILLDNPTSTLSQEETQADGDENVVPGTDRQYQNYDPFELGIKLNLISDLNFLDSGE